MEKPRVFSFKVAQTMDFLACGGQRQPGGAKSSQEEAEPGAARRSQEQPGTARSQGISAKGSQARDLSQETSANGSQLSDLSPFGPNTVWGLALESFPHNIVSGLFRSSELKYKTSTLFESHGDSKEGKGIAGMPKTSQTLG